MPLRRSSPARERAGCGGRRGLPALLFLIALLAPPGQGAAGLEFPDRPAAYVNDYAGLLAGEQRRELEGILQGFEKETTNQLVVATFAGLEGDEAENASIRLAEKWKVGQAGRDNGILLIVFVAERTVRFEVGYGLEGALPDALATTIIDQEVVPRFREGKYYEGIRGGCLAAMAAVKGEYTAPSGGQGKGQRFPRGLIVPLIILLVALFGGRRGRSLLLWWLILGGGRGGFTGGSGGFGGGSGGGGFRAGGGSFGGGGATGRW